MDGATVGCAVATLAVLALLHGALPVAATTGTQSLDPDRVVMHVELEEDGTAAWRIAHRTRLDDQNTSDAFDELQADIETNRSKYRERFADRMALTIADAENVTGRAMALRNVSVAATREQLPQEYGVVTYRFEWVGFAAVDAAEIRAGDALAGLFLDSGTSLVVSWPEAYELDAAVPEPDDRRDGAVSWRGPRDFDSGQPRVIISESRAPGGGILGIGHVGAWLVGVSLATLAVVLGLGGGWLAVRRLRGDEAPGNGPGGAPPDARLLSNEERVRTLLRDHEGRLKQQEIVDSLGWTDAKTSQVVGELRERGIVETFRLGRENVVTLADENDT